MPYTLSVMIRSFRHKGLRALYQGDPSGVRPEHVTRLRRVLAALDLATKAADMNLPGNHLHPLKGKLAGYWSISVSGNWRITFRFIDSDVELVDYLDYH